MLLQIPKIFLMFVSRHDYGIVIHRNFLGIKNKPWRAREIWLLPYRSRVATARAFFYFFNFFVMRHAKNNNATAQTMAELSGMLGLIGATKFQINYKPNKVTASCRFNGKSYGANATNFDDVITDLLERVKLGSFFHNQI